MTDKPERKRPDAKKIAQMKAQGQPTPPDGPPPSRQRMTVELPPWIVAWLRLIAEEKTQGLSTVVEELLREAVQPYIDRDKARRKRS